MTKLLRRILIALELDDVAAAVLIVMAFALAGAWIRTTELRECVNQLDTEQRSIKDAIDAKPSSEWGQDSMCCDSIPITVTCPDCREQHEMSEAHVCEPKTMPVAPLFRVRNISGSGAVTACAVYHADGKCDWISGSEPKIGEVGDVYLNAVDNTLRISDGRAWCILRP